MTDAAVALSPFRHTITNDPTRVIKSYCPECGEFVAASPSFKIVLIAEALHHCPCESGDNRKADSAPIA